MLLTSDNLTNFFASVLLAAQCNACGVSLLHMRYTVSLLNTILMTNDMKDLLRQHESPCFLPFLPAGIISPPHAICTSIN